MKHSYIRWTGFMCNRFDGWTEGKNRMERVYHHSGITTELLENKPSVSLIGQEVLPAFIMPNIEKNSWWFQ